MKTRLLLCFALLCAIALGISSQAHCASVTAKWAGLLCASDGAGSNYFGSSVALDGTTIVVGSPGANSVAGAHLGAAYVFENSGGTWLQKAKLTVSDSQVQAIIGPVAVDDSTVVMGSELDDVSTNAHQGSVYVFVKPEGGWADMAQTARLTASDGSVNARFGHSVALSGNAIVAGTLFKNAAYVFVKPAGGWADMTQTARLTASDTITGDMLGRSVAIDGDTIVAGAPQNTSISPGSGAAYVFVKPAGGMGGYVSDRQAYRR